MSKIISPIAIDMGAKNTGVYYAHYQRNSTFQEVDKKGQVLVYGNYTPLLVSRTANRHTRRGYTRKKLAKRLLSVVLKEYFDFPAEKHTQALGFLMNRRGFSFLEEEYSKEYLNNLPNDSWEALSEEVQKMLGGQENIADRLMNLATTNPSEVTKLLEAVQNIKGYKDFQEEDKEIKADLVYFDYIEKISKACKLVKKGESIEDDKVTKSKKDKQNLSKTANWVVARLNNENALNLTVATESYQTNLIEEITQINYQQIQNNLPDFEKEREVIKQRKKDNNTSDWKFNYSEFKFNTPNEKGLEEDVARTHLHHFCYAVYKINNEIISGGRHRSKFFDEIKDDLDNFTTNSFLNNKHNPEYLKDFILAINENKGLDVDKLYKLVCHISNFELKPLRKYFNTEAYKSGDKLDNKNLSKITSRWFLQHWIVTKEKDKEAKVEDYEKLKKAWRAHQKCQDDNKNNIISFWLKTDPKLTIPPYQAMLNRHPPKCQSLLLNADYLNKHYPHWEDWLDDLNSNEEYQTKLQSLQRGKGRRKAKNGKEIDGRLLDDEKIKTRQLQFILDTAKKQDFYKLNEIWSVYHKLQKSDVDKIKWQEKLEKLIDVSKLPKDLKQDLDFSQEESFGHFLNKYYQTRRKARDGRYFLIQEKKEKWLTNNKLLILCTHKPRQKKHQWQLDLAAVLGVNADDLKAKIVGNPEDYFKSIKGFASNCEKAAKAQKEHRGELKHKIYTELTSNPIDKLGKLANKCSNLKQELSKEIGISELLADKQTNEVNKKIALVFKFAQIHSIVFKDRSGFSKTCPVCSTDNAFRMQENDKGITKASRLPALSIRLIDGVVMRICDAIARQVAVTKWNDIKDDLQNGTKVSIPLILEQNRFEFEPSLKSIKKGAEFKEKDRIKDDRTNNYKGQKVSAYSGDELGTDGEIDHIIPRSSQHGTLNDEANLIYISKNDNQRKGSDIKFLKDLHKNYKTEIFDEKSDDEIKEFIYEQLGKDVESKEFAFGKYLSFINLKEDAKKAFRHALFLQEGDPLREKVISALNNRNRAIVNGTQRYLAQCIADKIHRIAKNENKHNLIEFDYLEYTARWDDPKSTYNLRKRYGLVKSKKQPLYSHLIDAQLAFLLASEDHQNDGTMGIKFDNSQTILEHEANKETGEISPSKSFNAIDVGESALKEIDLSPKDSNQKIIDIEKNNSNKKQNLSKIFKRPIFKQNAIGERYKPIVKFKDKWYLGYPMTIKGGIYNCDEYCQEVDSKNDIKKIEGIVNDNKYYQLTTDHRQIKIWTIKIVDKKYKKINKDSHRYFSQLNPEYSNDEKKEVDQIKFILVECKYYVTKTDVREAPKILKKIEDKKYPFYKNWVAFDKAWQDKIGDDYSVNKKGEEYVFSDETVNEKWNSFCRSWFSPHKNQHKSKHQVKGKKYTMRSFGTSPGTVFRVNRNNQNIYQALPLDGHIISKEKSNFLIKHSKNLTLSSPNSDKDLAKPIDLEEKIELKNYNIPVNKFFKAELEGVRVFLNNTSVDIRNFPLDKFREYFNKKIDDKGTIPLLTKETAESKLTTDSKLLYAHKYKVDDSIKYKTRDGGVENIKIEAEERLVSFSLPFRYKVAQKIYEDSKG